MKLCVKKECRKTDVQLVNIAIQTCHSLCQKSL